MQIEFEIEKKVKNKKVNTVFSIMLATKRQNIQILIFNRAIKPSINPENASNLYSFK